MYKEISKELKASLFQRIKSPFFGSFLIGLLIFNYRYVLVLLSTKSIEDKFHFIDNYKASIIINIPYFDFICIKDIYLSTTLYPFLFALISIVIFPYFERYISMPIWKKHQNRLKEKYAELEKEEIFLGSERDKYLGEILNIRKEKNQLVEELTNIDLATKNKIDNVIVDKEEEFKKEKARLQADYEINLKARANEIKNQKDEEIEKLNRKINENKTLMENLIDKHSAEIENKNIEIINLQNKSSEYSQKLDKLKKYEDVYNQKNELLKLREKKILKDFSIDEINFLRTIYQFNLRDAMNASTWIDEMINVNNSLKRITIQKILDDLIKKGFFNLNYKSNYIFYTENLKNILDSVFNAEEN
ncbi:hypothetical protein N5T98_10495 [Aliarcobacter cryaerophilus]|uniref:hypothetical protein n=1 Tax=Aliarcobacter cryaerophilus TaxID=28198 RepID=UPI0021B5CB51|nr:hypothetical protein [Aliarcobacter cryaerophilus]MCT7487046.1 hypothetical protein [Aliarcobacter cryaerophilus]MCT7491526.1 hypothetical protein [Aliarcobacter cryaerophilus]